MHEADTAFIRSMLPFWDRLTEAQAALLLSHTRTGDFRAGGNRTFRRATIASACC